MSRASRLDMGLRRPGVAVSALAGAPEAVGQDRAVGFGFGASSPDLGFMMWAARTRLAAPRPPAGDADVHTLGAGTRPAAS